MSLAIVPGSFDPITVGHVDVIERAAAIFDTVVVMVMVNREKSYMFDIDKRAQLAKLSCDHLDNVKVLSSEGMLVDAVRELGANAIIKGVRTIKDFKYEQIQAYYNKERNRRKMRAWRSCPPLLPACAIHREVRRSVRTIRKTSDASDDCTSSDRRTLCSSTSS